MLHQNRNWPSLWMIGTTVDWVKYSEQIAYSTMEKSAVNSPLKTLLNKPFSIGSPSYSSYGSGKVRLTFSRLSQYFENRSIAKSSNGMEMNEIVKKKNCLNLAYQQPAAAAATSVAFNVTNITTTCQHSCAESDGHRATGRSQFDQNTKLRGHREFGLWPELAEDQFPYAKLRIQSITIPWCDYANTCSTMHGADIPFRQSCVHRCQKRSRRQFGC